MQERQPFFHRWHLNSQNLKVLYYTARFQTFKVHQKYVVEFSKLFESLLKKNLKTETGVTVGTICHNTTLGRNIFGKKEAHCSEKNAEIVTITNSAVLAQSHYTKQKKTAVRRFAWFWPRWILSLVPRLFLLSVLSPRCTNSSPLYTGNNQM